MMKPPAEFTVICIDNARLACWSESLYKAQIEATKLYCETVFECNQNNIVSILVMSTPTFGELVPPTSDLKTILPALEDVHCEHDGETEFQLVLYQACQIFSRSPNHMKRRLLMFVGSLIHLEFSMAISYGRELKDKGVALDVFNFYHSNIDPSLYKEATMLCSKYHYARKELETLVTNANYNGSSHIEDVFDKSKVLDILSDSTLKEHLDYLGQKAAADDKYKSAADENVNVKQDVGPSSLIKKILGKPTLKQCQKDRNSPTENIPLGNPTLKQCQKDRNSPTDDECVQPPRKKNK